MGLRKGFTLVEALVVLALLASMLLIFLPKLLWMLQTYYVKSAASQMAIHLRFARNESVTRKMDYRIVINNDQASLTPNTYLLEYDPQDDATFRPVPHVSTTLPPGVEILNSAVFSSGVATVWFDSRGGAKSLVGSPPFSIDIRSVNGEIYRVQIQLTGAVQVTKV